MALPFAFQKFPALTVTAPLFYLEVMTSWDLFPEPQSCLQLEVTQKHTVA